MDCKMEEETLNERPVMNEYLYPMEELLERVLQQIGKSRSEFDLEVEQARQQSNPEMMANLIAMMLQNGEFTAQMIADLMMQVADLQTKIDKLEGGAS